ncbi:MAG: hypothetical protein IKD22_04745 [Lentisphaeria bacterium]|nr:hypothetical protein [Lentisphaeria bacterium]
MRYFLLLILFTCALNTTVGCKAIRSSFERGHHLQRRPKTAKPAVKPHRKGDTGDPVFDAVFSKRRREVRPAQSDLLTPQERKIADHVYSPPRPEDDPDLRKMRRTRMQNTKQKDWVFGTKNGSYKF